MDVVIFAAGCGSRLDKKLPKCLVEVGEKKIIDHQIDFIRSIVPDAPIYVVTGYKFDDVRCHLKGRGVHLIHNPFYDCSGIVGTAWLSLSHIKSPVVWRIDGDVIFTQSETIEDILDYDRTIFIGNNCPNPRETAYLKTVDGSVKGIGFADDYSGPEEWSCSEVYRNYDYQTIVQGTTHLIKKGHYFEAVNHAMKDLICKPNYAIIDGVYEIDTKKDLKNARKELSNS